MEIVEVYQTSRGIFRKKEIAELKKNRVKVQENYPPETVREEVVSRYAIVEGDNVFLLDDPVEFNDA